MQSLRGAMRSSRRAWHLVKATADVYNARTVLVSRSYGIEATSLKRQHKSKEERRALVVSFVEKYKASHAGQFPGITLVYKEVGGAYYTLKEIFQDLEKTQDLHASQNSTAETLRLDKTTSNTGEESATVVMDAVGGKESDEPATMILEGGEEPYIRARNLHFSVLNESNVEKRVLEQKTDSGTWVPDNTHSVVGRNMLDSGVSNEAIVEKETLGRKRDSAGWHADDPQPVVDALKKDDEADDDSDLAAPEYNESDQRSSVAPSSPKHSSSQAAHQSGFGMFVKFLPPSATSTDLIQAFEDCGEIVQAKVHHPRYPNAKYRYGVVKFKTEEGVNAARMKNEIIVNNIVVKLRQGFTKRLLPTGNAVPSLTYSENLKARNGNNGATAQGPSLGVTLKSEPKTAADLSRISSKELPGSSSRPWKRFGVGVLLQNIPLHIHVSDVREAMSQYGEVIGIEEKKATERVVNYVVWFKTEAAEKNALYHQKLILRGQMFRIVRLAHPATKVVRLSNISSQVTASKIRSTCENIGSVVAMESRRGGIVDVHFNVKETTQMNKIIDRLNKITLGEQKVKAYPAPRFFCGDDPDPLSKPKLQLVRQFKGTVLNEIELNMQQLSRELQDYREMLTLKRSTMLEGSTKS